MKEVIQPLTDSLIKRCLGAGDWAHTKPFWHRLLDYAAGEGMDPPIALSLALSLSPPLSLSVSFRPSYTHTHRDTHYHLPHPPFFSWKGIMTSASIKHASLRHSLVCLESCYHSLMRLLIMFSLSPFCYCACIFRQLPVRLPVGNCLSSVYLAGCLSASLLNCAPTCLLVCPCVSLSVYLSVCLSAFLPACLLLPSPHPMCKRDPCGSETPNS